MSVFFPTLSAAGNAPSRPRASLAVVAAVAAAHAGLLALLLLVVPAERLAEIARPLTVRMIDLTSEAPPPLPPPPKRMPEKARPQPPLPLITAATPPPVAEAPAAPAFTVAPQPPAPPAVPPAPTLAPSAPVETVTPVRFDAAYLNNPKPAYPAASRRFGETGKVVLRVHVAPDGRPTEVEIRTSSGHARLDNAARDAVTQWRFVPARRGEEAVAAWVQVPIVFSLEG